MQSFVVTGAAGFLGSHLVDRLLVDRFRVRGIDNLSTGRLANLEAARRERNFKLRIDDLTSRRTIPPADGYFHLASPASPSGYQRAPIPTLRVNSEGTLRILEAARRNDSRVLIASTSEVYGDPRVHPQEESYWGNVNPVGVRSCYDEGKRYSEALTFAYRRQYGLDARVARIFNTYGPRMDPKDGRVIASFICQGLSGRPFTVFGRGAQTRSFCYVSDLIEGLVRFMAASPKAPPILNLGNPTELTVLDAARLVATVMGIPFKVRYLPLPPDDPKQRCPDISLARRHLKWSPRIEAAEGIRETVRYFKAESLAGLQ